MKNFSVAKHTVKALVMHTSGSKDKSRLSLSSKTEISFGNKGKESQSDNIDQPSSQQSSRQASLKEFSVNEVVTDAEIYEVLYVVQNHFSLNSCRNKKSLFTWMLRNTKTAERFSCGSTKCSYIINFGIGHYFESLLDQALKEAPYFACSFNKSYNSTIKKGQMDMIFWFWDNSGNILSTRYYNSEFLWKATAVDINSKFQSCTKSLDTSKMIQFFLYFFFLSLPVTWWVFIQVLDFYKSTIFFLFLYEITGWIC